MTEGTYFQKRKKINNKINFKALLRLRKNNWIQVTGNANKTTTSKVSFCIYLETRIEFFSAMTKNDTRWPLIANFFLIINSCLLFYPNPFFETYLFICSDGMPRCRCKYVGRRPKLVQREYKQTHSSFFVSVQTGAPKKMLPCCSSKI